MMHLPTKAYEDVYCEVGSYYVEYEQNSLFRAYRNAAQVSESTQKSKRLPYIRTRKPLIEASYL